MGSAQGLWWPLIPSWSTCALQGPHFVSPKTLGGKWGVVAMTWLLRVWGRARHARRMSDSPAGPWL